MYYKIIFLLLASFYNSPGILQTKNFQLLLNYILLTLAITILLFHKVISLQANYCFKKKCIYRFIYLQKVIQLASNNDLNQLQGLSAIYNVYIATMKKISCYHKKQ